MHNSQKNYGNVPGEEATVNKLVLCDTCVIIDFINERDLLLKALRDNQFTLFINSIIEMELLYGAHDQQELQKIQKKLNSFRLLDMNQKVLNHATHLLTQYILSHRLNPPDAIIAATAVVYDLPLFTYNTKDFNYLPDVRLWDSSTFHPIQEEPEPAT